jgi:acetoin utilization protein AcuB
MSDSLAEVKNLKVSDLMTKEVVSVEETTTLQEALRLMVSKGVRHLPVCKDSKVVAVISDRDLRVMVSDLVDPLKRRTYFETTPVSQHASSPVISIAPDTSVQEAARMFVESRIGCVPVVDGDDRMVGIVSQTDLLKWLAQMTS